MTDGVRIDKWLWAARFFKTRSLAAAAVNTGKIEVDGTRPKPSRLVRVGDVLTVRKGPYELEVAVLALSEKRGSATMAAELYKESDESVRRREEVAASIKVERASAVRFDGRGRPTKKDRRELMKLMGQSLGRPKKPR